MMNPTPYTNEAAPGWYIPPWADPERQKRRAIRAAASGVSAAVVLVQLISALITVPATFFLIACGVNFMYPEANSIAGFPPTAYHMLSAFISVVGLVLPLWFVLRLNRIRVSEAIMTEKTGAFQGLLIALASVFICFVMNIPANSISEVLEGLGLSSEANTAAYSVGSLPDILAMFFSVAIVAPLTEEFAFRGATVAVMRRWGDWCAVLFSTVIFAMAHYSVQALPVVLMGGFVMAFVYVRTRNIWITVLIHFLNNLFATLPIAVEYFWGTEIAVLTENLSFIVLCALGIIAITILGFRHSKGHPVFRTKMQPGEPVRGKVRSMFVNPGFIIYVLVFIAFTVLLLQGYV